MTDYSHLVGKMVLIRFDYAPLFAMGIITKQKNGDGVYLDTGISQMRIDTMLNVTSVQELVVKEGE